MTLHDYKTGEIIRSLTPEESEHYLKISDNGECEGGTGAVDGTDFGCEGTVYAD